MSKRRHDDRPSIVRRALEARSHLDALLASQQYRKTQVRQYINSMNPPEARGLIYEDGIAEKWRRSLRVGEVYAVSAEMFHVVEQAGSEFPDDIIAEHHHLHAEHGFLWLPERIVEPAEVDAAPVDFLTWHHGTGYSMRMGGVVPGIEINLWTVLGDGIPYPSGSDFLPYGLPALGFRVHGYDGEVEIARPERTLSNASRFVLALQLLMRQELPSMNKWAVPRSEVSGLRRAALPTSPVTVIDLRRRQQRERDDVPDLDDRRHLTARHLVRGHWSKYHVGPNHPQHPGDTDEKVVIYLYRHAHVRGPADAPLVLPRERIHVVRR